MGNFFFRLGTGLHAKLYKLTGGRFLGGGENGSVLVLTHRGARSGKIRETPLMFMPNDDGFMIVASAGGAPHNPGWYHNLMANPDTTVNLRGETIAVRARDAGAERGALWEKIVGAEPRFGSYESKTDRTIPIVILDRR